MFFKKVPAHRSDDAFHTVDAEERRLYKVRRQIRRRSFYGKLHLDEE